MCCLQPFFSFILKQNLFCFVTFNQYIRFKYYNLYNFSFLDYIKVPLECCMCCVLVKSLIMPGKCIYCHITLLSYTQSLKHTYIKLHSPSSMLYISISNHLTLLSMNDKHACMCMQVRDRFSYCT